MMEAVRTSEMSVDNHFTQQYIPEDNSEQGKIIVYFSFKQKWPLNNLKNTTYFFNPEAEFRLNNI
jgi:hypothetical protein